MWRRRFAPRKARIGLGVRKSPLSTIWLLRREWRLSRLVAGRRDEALSDLARGLSSEFGGDAKSE